MPLAILPPPEPAPLWEILPVPAAYRTCQIPADWGDPVPDGGPVSRASNSVSSVDGMLSWNGARIDEKLLHQYLRAVAMLTPRPVTIVQASNMPCETLRSITALIGAELKCSPDLCVVNFTADSSRAVVAPAPSPQPPLKMGTRLQPISPWRWVTKDDYPAEAIRDRQQGTTSFKLDVDEQGAVTACTVTASSGSQLLDDAACTLLKARAKFGPAKDAKGRPIAAVYSNRFRWILPRPEPEALASWTSILRISIGTGGEVLSCQQQAFGPVPPRTEPGCGWLAPVPREEVRNVRGSAAGPVTIVIRTDYAVSGMPGPAAPALSAAFKPIWGMKVRREIQPDGEPSACYVDWGQGETPVSAVKCEEMGRYLPGTEWHSIVTTNAVLTDGDPNVGEALNTLTKHMSK